MLESETAEPKTMIASRTTAGLAGGPLSLEVVNRADSALHYEALVRQGELKEFSTGSVDPF